MDKKSLKKTNKLIDKSQEKHKYPCYIENFYKEYNPKKEIQKKSVIKEINKNIKDKSKLIIKPKYLYTFFYETDLQAVIDTFMNSEYSINYYLCKIKDIKKLTFEQILDKSNLKADRLKKYFIIKKCPSQRNPSRDALIALAFAFELNLEDLNYLLKIDGYNELYLKDKRDIIITKCFIEQKNVYQTNKILFLNKEKQIGNFFLYNSENINSK